MSQSPLSTLLHSPHRGAHARPASPSKSAATPLRRRLVSPIKKVLSADFITNWTPTRMTTQLQNVTADAPKRRAWDREPRKKIPLADTEGAATATRSQRTIYKRFNRPAADAPVTLRKEATPRGKAVKKMRLDGEDAGEVAAWDSPRVALPHKMLVARDVIYNKEDAQVVLEQELSSDTTSCEEGDLIKSDTEHDQEDLPQEGNSSCATPPHKFDELEESTVPDPVHDSISSPVGTSSPLRNNEQTQPLVETAAPEPKATPSKQEYSNLEDVQQVQQKASLDSTNSITDFQNQADAESPSQHDMDSEDNASVLDSEPAPLRRIPTPYNGSFKVPDFDDTEITEDSILDQDSESSRPDASLAAEMEISTAQKPLVSPTPAILADRTDNGDVDDAGDAGDAGEAPKESFMSDEASADAASIDNAPETSVPIWQGIEKEHSPTAIPEITEHHHENSETSCEPVSGDIKSEDVAISTGDQMTSTAVPEAQTLFDLNKPAEASTDNDIEELPQEASELEDMFDIDTKSLQPVPSPQPTPRPTTSQTLQKNSWAVEETTTTIQLNDNDDETVLRDFLSRSKANKAAKIARRSSLSNKRDSDAVRHALASPRKPLEDIDTNSPLMSPRKEQDHLQSSKEPASPTPAGSSADGPREEEDVTVDATVPSTRRSGRSTSSRALRQAPPTQRTITVRREDQLIIKRSEAQELAVLTRTNTRRNKGGSVPAPATLQRLQGMVTDELAEKPNAPEGKRAVRWNEHKLVNYFDEQAKEEAAAALPKSTEAAESAVPDPKPKARRAKALGAVNGTPAKRKTRTPEDPQTQQAASEESTETRAKASRRTPAATVPMTAPARSQASSALQTPDLEQDKENNGAGNATTTTKAAGALQRKSMVPRPRSSARLRKEV